MFEIVDDNGQTDTAPFSSGELINGRGHMTNMGAMPIYGKNLKKSSTELIDL